jgi:hypothetical protein
VLGTSSKSNRQNTIYLRRENPMKPVTLEEYKEVGPEFFEKYWYVSKELGEGTKSEDILKVMESLAGLVMKKRSDDKDAPMGFNKTVVE